MKKLSLLLLLLPLSLLAQIKIGNITIPDSVAQKYFLDCYSHPDTVKPKSEYEFYSCTNCTVSNEETQRAKNMSDDFNENLKKCNIGDVRDTVYYKASDITLYDGIVYASFDYQKGAKKITIKHFDAGKYVDWKGYLMPRKPSEQDFVKWYNEKNKK
jgi:hypothetical protein